MMLMYGLVNLGVHSFMLLPSSAFAKETYPKGKCHFHISFSFFRPMLDHFVSVRVAQAH